MSAIILFLFVLTIQKEVKENVELKDLGILTLSPSYDYHIYAPEYSNSKTIYFIIETELNTLPFDIYYTVRGTTEKKNITIYHQEQKGKLNALFFKYEKGYTSTLTLDFYISNIISQYAILVRSQYEESNSNFIRLDNPEKENKIQVYKNKPLIILFKSANYKQRESFQMTISSFNAFTFHYKIFASNTDIDYAYLLGRDYTLSWDSYTLYDNNTYEMYQIAGSIGIGGYKSEFIIFNPLIDDNITFQIRNVSYLPYINISPDSIGKFYGENIQHKMIVYSFNISKYYQDLFYFTIKRSDGYDLNYFYANGGDVYKSDVSFPMELKKVTITSKSIYDYCQMNRTNPDQQIFYFIVKNTGIHERNLVDVRSTFFDESNYTIHEPYSSYEYIINNNKKPNLPMVIGDFEYNDKFYFELEITFLDNNPENNIKKLDIYAKIFNQKAENYYEFRLENKDISLIKQFSTEYKVYYLYQTSDSFTTGVKSLFFFVNHKGKYPNCVIKYATLKEKPVIYEKNLIYLNQETSFYNTYNIFFLSLNLTGNSFITNDNIYINFESKKEAFNISKIYYRFDTSKANYDIDGNYSVCDYKIKRDEDKINISCIIPNQLAKTMNFILHLNNNYEINVNTEIIYRGNFTDSLSCVQDKKYIISNDAIDGDNYYVFISSNKDFNLNNISYNNIRSLDDFEESFPIEDYKEVKGFSDKRFYINIKNKNNKPFIGFKTEKIIIPFKIFKTKFDESNVKFINYPEKIRFNLTKDNPFIFVLNFGSTRGNLHFKLSTNIKIDYFNNITFFINTNQFQTFTEMTPHMYIFNDQVERVFYGEKRTIIYKQNPIYYNLYGLMINHTIEGEFEFEVSNTTDIYSLIVRDSIPYELKRGTHLIFSYLNKYKEYIFILKHYNSSINSKNVEIYRTDSNDFYSKKTLIYSVPFEYNNDNNNTYFYFNFSDRPYLFIYTDSYSKLTLRQTNKKENDIIKYYNLDESTIEIKDNNKIILIGGIEIDNINNGNYYFKYTLDSQYYNKLNTICYIDDEENIDNIVDFYERDKNNIRPIRYIKYEDKIDIYLETYNLQSSGQKSAVFIFDYYDNYYTLFIDLKALKQSLYTYHNVNRLQNTVFDIFSEVFFIDINISDFEDDNNEFIFFEISGPLSAFNSTQIYINDINDTQSEIFNEFYYCNKNYDENELIISCNYEKSNKDSIRFMLFLNEGNKITIKNIIPDKIIIPSDEDNADGDN